MTMTAESVATGAPPNIEALWREFAMPLRSFLRGRTGSAADADDLLQEVFLRLHRQLPKLRDPARLQGWIYRIARNVVIDHHRRRRHTEPLLHDPEAEAADPEGRDSLDLSSTLRRFIDALEPEYREPLIRHVYQGQPLAEVAAALGLTEAATKSRVRRARLQLRDMLERCCRFEFDRRGTVIDAIPHAACDCDGDEPAGPSKSSCAS